MGAQIFRTVKMATHSKRINPMETSPTLSPIIIYNEPAAKVWFVKRNCKHRLGIMPLEVHRWAAEATSNAAT